MNFVEPIRDRKKIAQIKNLLRGQERYRDLLLFVVGINTALRISDLLDLQIAHFLDDQGKIRQRFWIKEKKRGKRQEVVINESIREVLEEYLDIYPRVGEKPENFVFFNPKKQRLCSSDQTWAGLEVHHFNLPRSWAAGQFRHAQPAEDLGLSCSHERGRPGAHHAQVKP
jgi:integrase